MEFSQYLAQTDALTRSLYYLLLLMSIITWVVFILRLIGTHRLKQSAQQQLHHQVNEIFNQSKQLPFEQRKVLAEQTLQQQLDRSRTASERGVAVIGTMASISPFIGLLGTVYGVFHALHAMGSSGQVGLAQVATPVGEALIMTALGLAVAIPAVIAYNTCLRFNRHVNQTLKDEAQTILIQKLAEPTLQDS